MRTVNIAIFCSPIILVGCREPSKQYPTEVPPAKSQTASDVERSNSEMEITVIVLRRQLETADPDHVCFLAIGEDHWLDPPNSVMEALSDLPLELKPVSKARLPKTGELDPNNDATFRGIESEEPFRGVEDPSTGLGSVVYYTSITKWINDNTAEVSYGMYWGPVEGGGGKVIVQFKDGKWTIKEHFDGWVS